MRIVDLEDMARIVAESFGSFVFLGSVKFTDEERGINRAIVRFSNGKAYILDGDLASFIIICSKKIVVFPKKVFYILNGDVKEEDALEYFWGIKNKEGDKDGS